MGLAAYMGTKSVAPVVEVLGKCIVWYLKGFSRKVPSTCQPVRPTPVHLRREGTRCTSSNDAKAGNNDVMRLP